MREISTEKIKVGEHVIIDGVEYVAENYDGCDKCEFEDSVKCGYLNCPSIMFKRVKEKSQYRPYIDTEEMLADYKERFNVSNVPSFCMPLIWVKYKDLCSLITGIMPNLVVLDGDVYESMENLFENYTYLDGRQCGRKEK